MPGKRLMANMRKAIPMSSRPRPIRSSGLMPSRRRKPSRYSPAMAKSTIQAARNRSRVSTFQRRTWSRLAQVLQAGRQDHEAHHDLDPRHPAAAARQPLQIGGEQRQQKERQRQAGGERHHAGQRPAPPPATEAASSVPTNGPTQAKEASENVSPMSSVPAKPPLAGRLVQARKDRRRNGDFEGPQQAQPEGNE